MRTSSEVEFKTVSPSSLRDIKEENGGRDGEPETSGQ